MHIVIPVWKFPHKLYSCDFFWYSAICIRLGCPVTAQGLDHMLRSLAQLLLMHLTDILQACMLIHTLYISVLLCYTSQIWPLQLPGLSYNAGSCISAAISSNFKQSLSHKWWSYDAVFENSLSCTQYCFHERYISVHAALQIIQYWEGTVRLPKGGTQDPKDSPDPPLWIVLYKPNVTVKEY